MTEKRDKVPAKRRKGAADPDPEVRAELKRLRALTEEAIAAAARSDPLNPPLTPEELEDMELAFPATKQLISLRIDRPVIAWFKQQGPGYQTRMNTVLRNYYVREQVRRKKSSKPLEPEGPGIRFQEFHLRSPADQRREEKA